MSTEGQPDEPLVSCLMVTKNRANLARRALQCLAEQTWQARELVIVDDGEEDYEPVLGPYREQFPIHYVRLKTQPGVFLGALRNRSLEEASGEYCIQWDDDEWYDPQRISWQMRGLKQNQANAVVLKWTLMHIDAPDMVDRPYRADVGRGTPGTVLHRRTEARYPNRKRGEDTVFLKRLAKEGPVAILGREASHLFIRCFHGNNTWNERHFLKRLRRTPVHWVEYLRARYLKGDLFEHAAFQLNETERESIAALHRQNVALGLAPNCPELRGAA